LASYINAHFQLGLEEEQRLVVVIADNQIPFEPDMDKLITSLNKDLHPTCIPKKVTKGPHSDEKYGCPLTKDRFSIIKVGVMTPHLNAQ